ncbi:hypothetical protein ACFVZW_07510 [Streptomyces sp. NPDC059567]|uniref:hypothetical protein n=1 Tax=Streptomyces sp. NPDC059567 TaxID=3346867 RepID=UPI00367D1211
MLLLVGSGVSVIQHPCPRRDMPGVADQREESMTANLPPADLTTDTLARAWATGDHRAEAQALCDLGTALMGAGRTSEGRYLCRRAVSLAEQLGERDIEEAALSTLGYTLAQFEELGERWRAALLEGGDETEHFPSLAAARSDESYRTGRHPEDAFRLSESAVVVLASGFVAVKFLGPFVEAFATKLGERLGESAVAAAGRLRLLRNDRDGRTDLDVLTPGSQRTTLVLPEDFDDAARLGAIELDISADGVRGAELHWDTATGTWIPANT